MRLSIVVAVTLVALAGFAALPAPVAGEEGDCTTIEHDGHVHVYPEECVPDGNGGYYLP